MLSLYLTSVSPSSSPLTFQTWRNLQAIAPPRHGGSHLTRSITLCLFQLKLTPFAVKSVVMPCRAVTHPCYTCCPQASSVSGCTLCCYIEIYTVSLLLKGRISKHLPCGKKKCLVCPNVLWWQVKFFMIFEYWQYN